MSDAFNVDVVGLEGFLQRMNGAGKIVTEELATAGKRSGFLVERLAKSRARVWRGLLRRSITSATTVSPFAITTTVGTNVPYARTMNYGRTPGAKMPPVSAIAEYLRSKGKDPKAAFAVARSIAQRGIKGDHFLTGALEELKPRIRKEFADARTRAIARLRGR